MCNNGCILPAPGFLEGLRVLCNDHNIALIFDEVITGFRLGLGRLTVPKAGEDTALVLHP